MGDVNRCTPAQSPVPPSKTTAPVSPSKALSLFPFMNHTSAFECPSVVVEMGDRLRISSSSPTRAHQAICGVGGEPGLTAIDMMLLFDAPPGQTDPRAVLLAWERR